MSIELAGAVASIRLLMDVLKANKSLTNFNELVAAVSEVNADLLSAQAIALTSQKNEMVLTRRMGELEKEVAEVKDWNREAERYELVTITVGVFIYRVKPGMERGEPLHYLCTNCFPERKKSVLQFTCNKFSTYSRCPRCTSTISIEAQSAGKYFPERR